MIDRVPGRSPATARLPWRGAATAVRRRAPPGLARTPRRPPPGGGAAPQLRPRPAAERVIDLAGNDYLGLSCDPRVVVGRGRRGAHLGRGLDGIAPGHRHHRAARRAGAGAGRVLRGAGRARVLLRLRGQPRRAHRALRARGADRLRRGQPRLAGGRLPAVRRPVAVVPHGDVDGRRRRARRRGPEDRALVVTDSVNSVDGGLAPLAALHAVVPGARRVARRRRGARARGRGPGGGALAAAAGLAGGPTSSPP